MFDVAVSCLVLTALLSYLNHRFIGWPTTIGVMSIALLLSLALFGFIGNHVRALAMSNKTRQNVDMLWELLDSMLNAVLFVLIGLEVGLIEFSTGLALAAAAVIALTLTARVLSVGVPISLLSRVFKLPQGALHVLTWGGLRGGISVALALSLPSGPQRDLVLALTYAVVVFSILVQGLSIGKMVRVVGASDNLNLNQSQASLLSHSNESES